MIAWPALERAAQQAGWKRNGRTWRGAPCPSCGGGTRDTAWDATPSRPLGLIIPYSVNQPRPGPPPVQSAPSSSLAGAFSITVRMSSRSSSFCVSTSSNSFSHMALDVVHHNWVDFTHVCLRQWVVSCRATGRSAPVSR